MNRDEVMALPDKELRVKAVELAGWKCVPCAAECATNIAVWPWMKDGIRGLPPDYPHDIAAAMELMEYILARHGDWWADIQSNHSGMRWDVGFGDYVGQECYTAEAETVSLALTRAFVLAMTQDKP